MRDGEAIEAVPDRHIIGAERQRIAAILVRRYGSGESIRALAQSTGRSYGWIHRVLRESGVTFRPSGWRQVANLFDRLDPGQQSHVHEQIAARIKDAVRDGRIGQGQPLPMLTSLATYFDVAPSAVSLACTLLADEGVVRAVPDKSTFICGTQRGRG